MAEKTTEQIIAECDELLRMVDPIGRFLRLAEQLQSEHGIDFGRGLVMAEQQDPKLYSEYRKKRATQSEPPDRAARIQLSEIAGRIATQENMPYRQALLEAESRNPTLAQQLADARKAIETPKEQGSDTGAKIRALEPAARAFMAENSRLTYGQALIMAEQEQ